MVRIDPGKRGQSPIISAILYMLVSIIVVSIVLQIGVPYLNRLRAYSEIKNLEETMIDLDETISIVATEGEDSQRKVSISLSEDSMDVNGESEMIFVKKETTARVMNPRSRKSQGNYFKGVSLDTDCYSGTVNDLNVLIMENQHIYFAIRKLDSNTEMKTRGVVELMRFKGENADLNARVDFFADSHAGANVNISTDFVKSGYNEGWCEAKASVFGDGYQYEVHFRLESGADFVRAWVSDAVWS